MTGVYFAAAASAEIVMPFRAAAVFLAIAMAQLPDTKKIEVNVTTVGTYTVSTGTVNGYKFSADGSFATTGVQSIKLLGNGTPVTAQSDEGTFGGTLTNVAEGSTKVKEITERAFDLPIL